MMSLSIEHQEDSNEDGHPKRRGWVKSSIQCQNINLNFQNQKKPSYQSSESWNGFRKAHNRRSSKYLSEKVNLVVDVGTLNFANSNLWDIWDKHKAYLIRKRDQEVAKSTVTVRRIDGPTVIFDNQLL